MTSTERRELLAWRVAVHAARRCCCCSGRARAHAHEIILYHKQRAHTIRRARNHTITHTHMLTTADGPGACQGPLVRRDRAAPAALVRSRRRPAAPPTLPPPPQLHSVRAPASGRRPPSAAATTAAATANLGRRRLPSDIIATRGWACARHSTQPNHMRSSRQRESSSVTDISV